MTPPSPTLTELAERVQRLTGPCREMDARIWCAVFAPADAYVAQSRFNGEWCIYQGKDRTGEPRLWEDRYRQRIQPVTASLDAAMTLVPEGSAWLVAHNQGHSWAEVETDMQCMGASPALALVASVLRARSALEASRG